jgi:hypothetical protein
MSSQKWFFTVDAAKALDLPAEKLRELNRAKTFKFGFHVRDVSPVGSRRPTLQFNVERCEDVLNTPPEKRKCYE